METSGGLDVSPWSTPSGAEGHDRRAPFPPTPQARNGLSRGMASAQLYWGRQASLVLRLLYYIFPQVDWHLVFVDDYCWVLRCSRADWDATAILATLLALGVPLSWKKTALSPVNTWLGFVVDPITPCVLLAPVKHVIILATLKRLAQRDIFTWAGFNGLLRHVP